MDRDFRPAQRVHGVADLRLKKVSPAAHAHGDNPRQCRVREAFEAAGHVAHARAQEKIGQDRAAAADETAKQRPTERPARHKARATGEVISGLHRLDEFRDFLGQVAEAAVHFEDPVEASRECFAVTAKIGIDDAGIFGRPDDDQPGFSQRQLARPFERAIGRDAVEDAEHPISLAKLPHHPRHQVVDHAALVGQWCNHGEACRALLLRRLGRWCAPIGQGRVNHVLPRLSHTSGVITSRDIGPGSQEIRLRK